MEELIWYISLLAVEYLPFMLLLILITVSVYMLSFSHVATKRTFSQKNVCWGVKLDADPKVKRVNSMLPISFVVYIISAIWWMLQCVESSLNLETDMVKLFLPLVLMFLPMAFGIPNAKKWAVKRLEESKSALALGKFTPLQTVDEKIEPLKTLEIFRDGIVLRDATGFNFETILYSHHELGNLDDPKAMLMIAAYFLQKHPNKFKLDIEENPSAVEYTGNTVSNAVADTVVGVAALSSSAKGARINHVVLTKK